MAKAYRASSAHRLRRILAAATLALLAVPALAQQAQGPPDGFRPPLDDRPAVQGPADNGIPPLGPPLGPPPAQPQRTDPRPAVPPPVADPQPAPQRQAAPVTAPARTAPPLAARPTSDSREMAGDTGSVAPQPAPPAAAPTAGPVAALPDAPLAEPQPPAPVASAPPATAFAWPEPWVMAAVALLLGGGLALLLWRRRRATGAVAGLPVVERTEPPVVLPPVRRPLPPPPPRPQPASAPDLAHKPEPKAAPQPVPATAGRAHLTLTLQVNGIEITGDAARFSFTLLLANSGDRAAVGGLVRIALQQAHPQQAIMLERFFDGAGGSVLAEDVEIAPGDVGSVERHALLPLSAVEPMMIGGYPSLVPVIGFDTSYHWDGQGEAGGDEFGQVAAAFVIGTASAADGRVAPVRLDHGPRRLTNPVARLTEMQRTI